MFKKVAYNIYLTPLFSQYESSSRLELDNCIMKQIFSVSQVNSYIRRIFESDYALKRITIKGEVSNCKYHSSGHIYFSLKDERSQIKCVMFQTDSRNGLAFRLENGQQVTVNGRIAVFERDGTYQLYAKEIQALGAGELYLKFEQLKQELLEKGYFDFERKKPLPAYPEKIGIVTALTGAAIEDIKSVALRRNPYIQLYLYPARVQGEGASASIARGIRFFDSFGVDVIIIGRGGGSMEDLWAFNERCVADAIFHANTPIISGTGHEVDMTIADYCADVRAATPTAACEVAIYDVYALMQEIDHYQEILEKHISFRLGLCREKCKDYRRILEAHHPGKQIEKQKSELSYYGERLKNAMDGRIRQCKYKYELYLNKLNALSPTARLKGGYVYAHDADGNPISSIKDITLEQNFYLTLKDGEVKILPKEYKPGIDIR